MKRLLLTALLSIPFIVFGQTKTRHTIPSTGTYKFDIYKYAPTAPVEGKTPVIICYPGVAEKSLDAATGIGIPLALKNGLKIPFAVITHGSFSGWYDTAMYTQAILNWIWKHPDLDTNRVYLTGLSAGGNGVYAELEAKDDRIAAYAPVAINSNGFTRLLGVPKGKHGPRLGKDRPVWHFHGGRDGVPNQLVTTAQFFKEYNAIYPGRMKLTVLSNRGHGDSWPQVYGNKMSEPTTGDPWNMTLYDWFLQFTLWPAKPVPPVDPPAPPVIVAVVENYYRPDTDSIYFKTITGKLLRVKNGN